MQAIQTLPIRRAIRTVQTARIPKTAATAATAAARIPKTSPAAPLQTTSTIKLSTNAVLISRQQAYAVRLLSRRCAGTSDQEGKEQEEELKTELR